MALRVLSMADMSACDDVLDPLRQIAEVVVAAPDAGVLRDRIGEFDAYLASLHVRLDGDAIRSAKRLKIIATPTTGLDHIDLAAADARGIPVLSLRDEKAFL